MTHCCKEKSGATGTLRQFCYGRCSVANADSRHRYQSGLNHCDAAGNDSLALRPRDAHRISRLIVTLIVIKLSAL
jgi:hypothetical protein